MWKRRLLQSIWNDTNAQHTKLHGICSHSLRRFVAGSVLLFELTFVRRLCAFFVFVSFPFAPVDRHFLFSRNRTIASAFLCTFCVRFFFFNVSFVHCFLLLLSSSSPSSLPTSLNSSSSLRVSKRQCGEYTFVESREIWWQKNTHKDEKSKTTSNKRKRKKNEDDEV